MKCMRSLRVPLLLLGLSFAASAHAQTASGAVTGSGGIAEVATDRELAIVRQELEELNRAVALYRMDDVDVLVDTAKDEAEAESLVASIRRRQTERRKECRMAVRRSGKEIRWQTVSGCFREDLQQQIAMQEKRLAFLEKAEGMTESARVNALVAARQLIDALRAVIDGIDGKVYETEEDLLKAKTRLLDLYRRPLWTSLTRLRADRALRWTARLADDLREPISALRSADETTLGAARAAVSCLSQGADRLLVIPTLADGTAITTELAEFHKMFPNCKESLSEAVKAIRSAIRSSSSSSAASEQ